MARPATDGIHRDDRTADWFADDRGIERRLKVSWHPEQRLVVLSLWHEDTCTATFRLPVADVPRLVATLVAVLGDAAGRAARSMSSRVRSGPGAWRPRRWT